MNPVPISPTPAGSLDGSGAGDHDVTYTFGRRPRASAPYPFSTRQFARLLILRARLSATHQMEASLSRVVEGAA